jgi:Protein of unknown function (DUF4058)
MILPALSRHWPRWVKVNRCQIVRPPRSHAVPSPFPGIDPYLESQHLWEGFHARFVTYFCDALNDVLPETYVAELGEHFYLVELSGRGAKQVLSDIAVIEGGWKPSQGGQRLKRSRGAAAARRSIVPTDPRREVDASDQVPTRRRIETGCSSLTSQQRQGRRTHARSGQNPCRP